MRRILAALGMLTIVALPAYAQNVEKAPPGGQYKKVSELVKLPDFLPGLGTLYVDPKTLPAGPFLGPRGQTGEHDLHDPDQRYDRPEEI
jgi:hypothetical protein